MEGDFRALLRKFCLESTILGLKHFYLYPDVISRCFWIANLLGSLSLACLLSVLLYTRFSEMPTRVTIENQYEPVQNLPFPAITICSPNQITASFMTHFNRTLVDGNLTIDLEKVLPKLLGFYEYVGEGDITNDMYHLQSLLELNRYTVPEVMALIPQSCNDFLKLCFFEGVRYPNCSSLFKPILTAGGFCCTFNNIYYYHEKRNVRNDRFVVKNVTRSGLYDGLIVITDYNPEDAVDGSILDAGAIKIMYTDHSEFPVPEEAILVEPGIECYNALHATYTYCSEDVKALPSWSRKCYFEDEHHVSTHFRGYHNSDCVFNCFAQAVRKYCNCTLFYIPGRLPVELICNLTKIPCITDVKVHRREQCDCPRDCESRRYKADMIIGNLGAIPYLTIKTFKGIKFNDSTNIMKFYFPKYVYVKQKQETVMSLITLASNLGGVFGLCLGCSGISILEIFFYMFVAIRNWIKRKIELSCKNKIKHHK